jgi:single-strand DNA-binding protein
MADLNRVFLMGRLTRDPELRYTAGGSAVTDLGVAINRSWTNKDGERREEAVFVDVTVWNRQAETCCQYLKKGRSIHVEGFLRMDTWDDRTTGEKRSKLRVEADRIQFLDSRRDESAGADAADDSYSAPAPRDGQYRRGMNAPAASNAGPGSPRAAAAPNSGPVAPPRAAVEPEDYSDDIPF